ncbi:hypothetical protein NKJ06_16295 [Mesorhizobium sp. M0293]|uniref:hypothetical protein n=1 Tax=Mesorhizobium sp. M0293 TaxID=2956930 RepID=UPI00333BAAC9
MHNYKYIFRICQDIWPIFWPIIGTQQASRAIGVTTTPRSSGFGNTISPLEIDLSKLPRDSLSLRDAIAEAVLKLLSVIGSTIPASALCAQRLF